MKKQCIVIVPIYQEHLNEYEQMSIINTFNKLHSMYDINAICAKDFNMEKFYKDNDLSNYEFDNYYMFDTMFFKGIHEYNSLMLLDNFYYTFSNSYDYMLIVQTDAYIFKNDLLEIINKEYKFIGAPVIFPETLSRLQEFKRGIYYNGGFSLRNIEFCLETLKDKEFISNLHDFGYYDEDMIFSAYCQEHYKSPTYLEALQFSIDNQIDLYLPALNFQQPFGTHHFWNDDDNGNNKLQILQRLKWV